jgi:hypothetical protein
MLPREHFDLRLAETKNEVLRWMIGQAAVILGAVAALIRLLH